MSSEPPPTREWAVVTGASAGIGRQFALALSDRGHPVLLVARRREELEGLGVEIGKRGARARVLVADLATTEGVDLVRVVARLGDVGVLVNNAGFGSYGPFLQQPVARELEQVALNVGAIVALTRALLPQMVARKRGQIINVASVLSFMPTPYRVGAGTAAPSDPGGGRSNVAPGGGLRTGRAGRRDGLPTAGLRHPRDPALGDADDHGEGLRTNRGPHRSGDSRDRS